MNNKMDGTLLEGQKREQALKWLDQAEKIARESICCRRRCGSILVKTDGSVIAGAVNKLPGKEGQAVVHCTPYKLNGNFKSDKACCIHAEERTIMQALAEGHDLTDSIMVFTSVDDAGNRLPSGRPYCTICSKMALEAGVSAWILEHEEGIISYDSAVYNALSFAYSG